MPKAGMAIRRRHKMPQQPILFCEVFYVWGIDFIGPFPASNGYSYILLVVDYVSRWVEAIVISHILYTLQGLKMGAFEIIWCLRIEQLNTSLSHSHHPQTNGQAEVFNRKIKKTLQKMVNPNRKDWS
ncbi:Pro-Pol polyprotein, partial [Mucuna pruriens]